MGRILSISNAASHYHVTDKAVYDRIKTKKLSQVIINNEKFIVDDEIKPRASVISLVNHKGGVGKTTSSINIAAYLAKCGLKVLLIDTDHQSQCRHFFQKPKHSGFTIANIFFEDRTIEEVVSPTDVDGLFIIDGDYSLSLKEMEIYNKHFILRNKLEPELNNYDFIIIDNHPSLNTYTLNAIFASQWIIVPTHANYLGFEGLAHLVQSIRELIKHDKIKILGILLTQVEKRHTQFKFYIEEIEKAVGNMLFNACIEKDVRLSECATFSKNIFDYKEKSRGAQAYKMLSSELVGRITV